MRLDVYLHENKTAKSRAAAARLISEGAVSVNGQKVLKPSKDVSEQDRVELTGDLPRYVGRGGLKLEKALTSFGISVKGLVCLDIGASTGGFTDCMLQNGAAFVYALDVGHGQLDGRLLADTRVQSMEGINARDVCADIFPKPVDFISADVSFISLKKIIPRIKEILDGKGSAVLLVKPQFECGRANIGKNGIVRSEKTLTAVLSDMAAFCISEGLSVMGGDYSPIRGGDGNIEFLLYAGFGENKLLPGGCAEIVRAALKIPER